MIPIRPEGEASVSTQALDVMHAMRPGVLQFASLPPLSLYVHLPWCLKKCPYCDFNSHEWRGGAGTELPESAYVDALLADLEASLPLIWGRSVHSIFLGGGTPSLFFAARDRPPDQRPEGPIAPGSRLRNHPGGQSGHFRERPIQSLSCSRCDPFVDRRAKFQ
jgi:hypothetical protein